MHDRESSGLVKLRNKGCGGTATIVGDHSSADDGDNDVDNDIDDDDGGGDDDDDNDDETITIESTRTTSMADVSTWVLEKIKNI